MSNDANKLRQRQEIRKYLVFAGMFLLFVGCMWLIFAPSKEERQREERNHSKVCIENVLLCRFL